MEGKAWEIWSHDVVMLGRQREDTGGLCQLYKFRFIVVYIDPLLESRAHDDVIVIAAEVMMMSTFYTDMLKNKQH